MHEFRLEAPFGPAGDQPEAIRQLVESVNSGRRHQVLLGVTGSGKTFTVANVIERVGRPVLVMAHNKTLAAQLYREFKELFPSNSVEYFVSYYDYYQPEAYVPRTDTYIAKESSINDEIDRLRHSATRATLERRDTIVVASVSCIFALGNPEAYRSILLELVEGQEVDLDGVLRRLVQMQYTREVFDFYRGCFRLRGDTLEIFPSWEAARVVRVSLFGDTVERLEEVDPLTGKVLGRLTKALILANSHHVTPPSELRRAARAIRKELKLRCDEFHAQGHPYYAERLEQRTSYDLELLEVAGHCAGIENYSRHLDGRATGEPPWTLLDYFPKDFLCVIDESHVSLPQIRGMYKGDRARKQTLVDYGFRLPSALDNRPLTFEEWLGRVPQLLHVSATPGEWEVEEAEGRVVEQIVRPTGLLDPVIEIRPAGNQVESVLDEVKLRVARGQRSLIATLTKRMAEDLTEHLRENGVSAAYMHADVETLERVELLHALRSGKFDVLVGINLLREGLDLPEVSLVAVLDADKEGFLRATRSLIQVSGRAARHVEGTVLLFADKMTDSMRATIEESSRRRAIQQAYNEANGIIPVSISKALTAPVRAAMDAAPIRRGSGSGNDFAELVKKEALEAEIASLRRKMSKAAKELEFEEAARLRDEIARLQLIVLEIV